jgi:hypothetical protein
MRYAPMPAALAAAAMLLAAPAAGQENAAAPAPAAPVAPPASPGCCAIPALTPVDIEFTQPVTSKDNHPGDRFTFRLAEPIVVDGRVLAPAGTPGVGEVVHAARARAMGKAGELILAARYLDLGGQRVPLRTFRYGRSQGKDPSGSLMAANTVAAAVLPIAGLASFFIAGGDVRVPAGTRATAKVAAETIVPPASSTQEGGMRK